MFFEGGGCLWVNLFVLQFSYINLGKKYDFKHVVFILFSAPSLDKCNCNVAIGVNQVTLILLQRMSYMCVDLP